MTGIFAVLLFLLFEGRGGEREAAHSANSCSSVSEYRVPLPTTVTEESDKEAEKTEEEKADEGAEEEDDEDDEDEDDVEPATSVDAILPKARASKKSFVVFRSLSRFDVTSMSSSVPSPTTSNPESRERNCSVRVTKSIRKETTPILDTVLHFSGS